MDAALAPAGGLHRQLPPTRHVFLLLARLMMPRCLQPPLIPTRQGLAVLLGALPALPHLPPLPRRPH